MAEGALVRAAERQAALNPLLMIRKKFLLSITAARRAVNSI
jgi:hypothetical protein